MNIVHKKIIKYCLFVFPLKQKTPEEQKELLYPIVGNILKMTIRTLSTKRMKKAPDVSIVVINTDPEPINRQATASPKPLPRPSTSRLPGTSTISCFS